MYGVRSFVSLPAFVQIMISILKQINSFNSYITFGTGLLVAVSKSDSYLNLPHLYLTVNVINVE